MTDLTPDLGSLVERLRQEFDQTFARPTATGGTALEAVLAIKIRETPFALRLSEIAGLFADRAVTRLPGPFPDLLGVAGFRGAVVPVFDLGALLGARPVISSRWLVLTDRADPVALAFDHFERLELLVADAVSASRVDGGAGSSHAQQVVRTADGPRPLINVASILAVIDARVRQRRDG